MTTIAIAGWLIDPADAARVRFPLAAVPAVSERIRTYFRECTATMLVASELVIRASKTDQRQAGARVFVPNGGALCPVRALERWLGVSGTEEGPLFRRISRADWSVSRPVWHLPKPVVLDCDESRASMSEGP